jgi:hypothetical protein
MIPFLASLAVASIITGAGITFTHRLYPFALVGGILLLVGTIIFNQLIDQDTSIPMSLGLSIIPGIGAGVSQLLSISFAQTGLAMEVESVGLNSVLMLQLLGGYALLLPDFRSPN